jgi:hypothetical protein
MKLGLEENKMKRFVTFVVAVSLALIPLAASAQFGLGKKKNKFNTKPINQLLGDIDKVVEEYEGATENVRTATETVQGIVKGYADGEFPILTKPWAEIRKEIKEAKDEAAKTAAVELSNKYLLELEARKKAVEAFLADPAKTADLQGKLQAPEVAELNKIVANLKPVPAKDAKIIKRSGDLNTKAAKGVADLTKQIGKNPLKANDYKKLIKKLNTGIDKLTKIPTELNKQVDAITTMLANLDKLLTK